MDPEQQQPQTPPATEPTGATPAPQANTNAVFTQEDINRFVAAERRNYQQKLNDATAELERLKTAPKSTPKEDEPTLASLRAELQSERNARVFAEATAGKQLNAQQRGLLRDLFEKHSPDDPIAWADTTITALGINASPASPPPIATAPPTQPGNMPAATAAPNLDDPNTDWRTLTREQRNAMGREKVLALARAFQKRHG